MATIALGAARRRTWFDPRIAIGLALVAASVAGVVGVVAVQDRAVTVYTASSPLAAGARVTRAELTPSRMRLGDAQALYLSGRVPAAGYVVTRSIATGELVPLSALGSARGVDAASVVVTLSTRPAASIGAGSTVDLWAAPKDPKTPNAYGAPVMLVGGAAVVRLVQPDGIVPSGQQNGLEVQVPRDDVARVLQAVADADAVSAVAVSEPVRR